MMSDNKNTQVRDLLMRIAEDDELAFSEFFDLYHVRMIRFSYLYVKDMQGAEDVVSEVLIKLLRHRKTLYKIDQFGSYLFSAIKNQSLNYLRERNRGHVTRTLEEEKDLLSGNYRTPFDTLVEKELLEVVSKTTEALPPVRKLTFQFIHEEGMTKKEVAALLGISVRTVEVHVSLAVKQIRQAIRSYNQDNGRQFRSLRKINAVLMPLFFA